MVEILPGETVNFSTEIAIYPVEGKKKTSTIVLNAQFRSPINLSSATLFFGNGKAGESVERTLVLSNNVSFKILRIESSAKNVMIRHWENQEATEHNLTFAATFPVAGELFEGKIQLFTDVPSQGVIEVPFIGKVQ